MKYFRAAFQYGVKMADGRKTRRTGTGKRDEKTKLDRELQKINQVNNNYFNRFFFTMKFPINLHPRYSDHDRNRERSVIRKNIESDKKFTLIN